MGMHENGRDFNSMLYMELLFATFLSGGFHPVFTEKWHDRNAAYVATVAESLLLTRILIRGSTCV